MSQSEFTLNSTIADAHGKAPFEVVYGFTPALPLDVGLSLSSHSVENLVTMRSLVHSQVAQALSESAAWMKLQADGHRRETSLAVGQRVWLATSHLPLRVGTRKLAAKWAGPFRITAQISPEAWRLQLPASWKIHHTYHSSQLKAVVGNPRVPEPIALEDGQAAEELEVERLLGRRQVRG